MQAEIHPKWHAEAIAVCSCGNSWTVGSTLEQIRTDVCNACHPFFTGEQRIVDTEGQVDRFYQRLERRAEIQAELDAARDAVVSGQAPISDLELTSRSTNILLEAGYSSIANVIAQLEKDENELLALQGFGQKSLIDLKKRLRADGYIK